MTLRHWTGLLLSMIVVMMGTAFSPPPASSAASNPPPGPDRYTVITVDYTAYTWWVANWSHNQVVCSVVADHEGPPTPEEIYRDCGSKVYEKWITQPPCMKQDTRTCIGYYIFPVEQAQAQKQIPMELPAATAWLLMVDCEPVSSVSTTICENLPSLVVMGQEPLPNETITRIEGTFGGRSFACDGAQCVIPLEATDPAGVEMEFWAFSSYGDSSPAFTAIVRAAQADEGDPDRLYWYVDVLSSQWQGQPPPTCSDSWESFPPVGGTPFWLSTPVHHEDLASDIPYTYLAANLILQGAVDARSCPDGGLVPGGGVNTCGLEAARPAVNAWQDQFDALILNTSQETGVPAHLLKNLFARESQFWPGIFRALPDVGLGQLTENGADTTLFWNPSFFAQFCPLVLSSESCGKGYLHLAPAEQLLLRQALVGSVNATCADCPLGLDLSQADFSVSVFAHTMVANCEQAGRVVRNITGDTPGHVASYEDLWRFTLVNYNAGPGCLADALEGAQLKNLDLTWDNVSSFLPGACTTAIDYVNDIARP
ncbi:MAG: hypothetical protein ACM3QS_05105 [Bacteroidota bacterium]